MLPLCNTTPIKEKEEDIVERDEEETLSGILNPPWLRNIARRSQKEDKIRGSGIQNHWVTKP